MHATRTYLEMGRASDLQPAAVPAGDVRLQRLGLCPASFYRYLYREVGHAFGWVDRTDWADAEIDAHTGRSDITLWLLSIDGAPAGYAEVRQHADASIEIAYFGLLPQFFGRGAGGWLLSEIVRLAWSMNPARVWLHTCSLDHPAALPNYLARGFHITRTEEYDVVHG